MAAWFWGEGNGEEMERLFGGWAVSEEETERGCYDVGGGGRGKSSLIRESLVVEMLGRYSLWLYAASLAGLS